jgi:ribose transport system permease protein
MDTPRQQIDRSRIADPAWRRRQIAILLAYGLALTLFALVSVYSPGFASAQSIRTLVQQAAILGVVAIGQTLVIMTGGIDLSVAGMMSTAAVLLARLAPTDADLPLALGVVLAVALIVGLVNGISVGVFRAPAIIVTLGVNGVLVGSLVVTARGVVAGQGNLPSVVQTIAAGDLGPVPVAALFWGVLIAIVTVVLAFSTFGRRVYAVGNNPVAARLSGVNVAATLVALYVISAVTSALAGWVLAGYLGQAYSDMGDPYLFISITAVLVGGASMMGGSGNYLGTVAGVLILTILGGLLAIMNLGSGWLRIIYGAIVFLAVAASPLFNRARR